MGSSHPTSRQKIQTSSFSKNWSSTELIKSSDKWYFIVLHKIIPHSFIISYRSQHGTSSWTSLVDVFVEGCSDRDPKLRSFSVINTLHCDFFWIFSFWFDCFIADDALLSYDLRWSIYFCWIWTNFLKV